MNQNKFKGLIKLGSGIKAGVEFQTTIHEIIYVLILLFKKIT